MSEGDPDLKVALSRVAAYQQTCDVQGRKLAELEAALREASIEKASGDNVAAADIRSLHYKDPVVQKLASILTYKVTASIPAFTTTTSSPACPGD